MERAAGAVPPELPGGGAPGAPDLLVGATILVEDARVAVPTSRAGPSVTLVPAGTSPADAPPAASGRSPELERLRLYGGGLLVCLCLAMFGWIVWRGREPAPVTIRAAPAGSGAEIKVQVNGAVATPGVYRLLQGDRVEDAIRAAGGLAPDADPNRLNLAQRVRDEQRLDVPFLRQPPGGEASSPAPEAAGDAPGATAPARRATAAARGASTPRATATPRPEPTPRPSATPKPEPSARPSATPRPEPTARPSATPRPERPSPSPRPTEPAQAAIGKINVNTATAAQLEKLPGIGEISARRIIEYREANGPITSLEQLRQAGISDTILRRAADYLTFE